MCDHRMRLLNMNLAHQFISLYFFQNLSWVTNSMLLLDCSLITGEKYFTCKSADAICSWCSSEAISPSFNGFSCSFTCRTHLDSRVVEHLTFDSTVAGCRATTLGKMFTPTHLAGCSGLVLAYLAEVWETAVSRFIATATAIYTVFGIGCWTFMQSTQPSGKMYISFRAE